MTDPKSTITNNNETPSEVTAQSIDKNNSNRQLSETMLQDNKIKMDVNNFCDNKNFIDDIIANNKEATFSNVLSGSFNLGDFCDNFQNLNAFIILLQESNCDKDFIQAIIRSIHDGLINKIKEKEGRTIKDMVSPYYRNIETKCLMPTDGSLESLQRYINDIIFYLDTVKKDNPQVKSAKDILKDLKISNNDINERLSNKVDANTKLSEMDSSIKKNFNTLLRFEQTNFSKGVEYKLSEQTHKLQTLFSNSIPGITTLINDLDYKFDDNLFEEKHADELYQIRNNDFYSFEERDEKINNLRWKFYIERLKTKDSRLSDFFQKLRNYNFDFSKFTENPEELNLLKLYLQRITTISKKKLMTDAFFKRFLNECFQNDGRTFDEFYTNLFDIDNNELILDENLGIKIPIQKTIREGGNSQFNNFIQLSHSQNDSIPIEFSISKKDIYNLNLSDEDKLGLNAALSKINKSNDEAIVKIGGEDAGLLIWLFWIFNNKTHLTDIDDNTQKVIENDIMSNDKEKESDSIEKDPTDTPENFKSKIEKFGKSEFKDGAEIWMPIGDSNLPGGGRAWFKIKISDVDLNKGTFKGTSFGGELGCKKNEGVFDMNKATLEKFQTGAKDGKILLLGDPSESDFSAYLKKLGTENLTFPPEGAKWDENKFTHNITDENGKEKEEMVENFGINDGDKLCTYKIKYQPGKKTFLVSGNFDGKGQDEKDKDKLFHYSYKREMDWNNFLIFMNEKKLKPQNKKEIEAVAQKQKDKTAKEFKIVNGRKLKLTFVSINSFKSVFKTITGDIKKQLDAYNKSQADKFEDILVDDWGLYEKLGNILGFIPSMKEAFGNLQQEHYNKIVNGNWSHIEGYLKGFQEDKQFGDTFETLPPYIKTKNGKPLNEWILNRFKQDYVKLEESEEVWQCAALCLANLQQGGSIYRGLTKYEDQGLWVKILLGSEHWEDFKASKAACLRDLQKAKDSGNSNKEKELQSKLATCEIDYICNNITGSNGYDPYFGAKEKRGIPGTNKHNDYVVNPAKAIFSEKFAKELDGAKTWFNRSSTEEAYKKAITSNGGFPQAKADVERLMKSSRHPGGVGNFQAMLKLAKEKDQINDCKKYFLVYMLSGVLDRYGSSSSELRDQAYEWARTRGFAPGMLAKDSFHSEGVAELLQDFSKDFKSNVNKYLHKEDFLLEDKDGCDKTFKILLDQFNTRWKKDPERDEKFDKYLHIEFPTKDFSDKPLLQKLQKSLNENSSDKTSSVVLENAKLMKDARLLAPPSVIHNSMLDFDNNGRFKGEGDVPDDKKEFWEECTKNVKSITKSEGYRDITTVNRMLDKYLGWFRTDSRDCRQELLKYINTAKHYQDKINAPENKHKGVYYTPYEKALVSNKKTKKTEMMPVPLGRITQGDINKILLYGFEGLAWNQNLGARTLPQALQDTLDAFQTFFEEAFRVGTLYDKNVKNKLSHSQNQDEKYNLCGRDMYNLTKLKSYEIYDGNDEVEDNDFSALPLKQQKNIINQIVNRYESEYLNRDMDAIESHLKKNTNLSSRRKLSDEVSNKIKELQYDSPESTVKGATESEENSEEYREAA